MSRIQLEDMSSTSTGMVQTDCKQNDKEKRPNLKYVLIICALSAVVITLTSLVVYYSTLASNGSATKEPNLPEESGDQIMHPYGEDIIPGDGNIIDDGDYCRDERATLFPNVGYSLYGYDLLKGFPLSDGVDPGFTRPIFAADYSSQRKTADCRYIIPGGLSAAPDEACDLYFSSNTLNTTQEFYKVLTEKASAGFSFLGSNFSFSASTTYEKTSQVIDNKIYKLVISTANCHYYSTKLNEYSLPPFSQEIESWLIRLNTSIGSSTENQKSEVLSFMDYFGTHIPTKVIYGATYTKIYKMRNSSYYSLASQKSTVNAQASLSSFFSLNGGQTDESTMKEIVSKFQSLTEVNTRTLGPQPTVNGDTVSWAEPVKQSPAPIKYKLTSLRSLFSYENLKMYMPLTTVNKFQSMLKEAELEYCYHLSATIPYVQCENRPSNNSPTLLQSIGIGATISYADFTLGNLYPYTLDRCFLKCKETAGCAIALFRGTHCYLGKQSDLQKFSPKADSSSSIAIFQNRLTTNKILSGYRFDHTAERGQAFRISETTNDHSKLIEQCAEFCKAVDDCRAFEVTNKTEFTYNCVLLKKLGKAFWANIPKLDFETVFVAFSPESPLDKSTTVSLKVSNLEGAFNTRQGCISDSCCRLSCSADSLCLVSAFDTNNEICHHMSIIHSVFTVESAVPTSPFSITVYPERAVNSMLTITGYSFPDAQFSKVYQVYSAEKCATFCAANAQCTAASWDGIGKGNCVLHDNSTINLSARTAMKEAVLLFPKTSDRFRACQIAV